MNLEMEGKRVLVMASSQGIGKAIAHAFVNEGAKVALSGRSADRLEVTRAEVGADFAFTADFTQPGSAKSLVENVMQKWDGLDVLITNAGGPPAGAFDEISTEKWKEAFQSLWLAPIEAMNVALPAMKANQWGRIVMITSLAAKEPVPGLTTSNGLRSGLPGLCRSISNEYAPFGVTLNLILPGYINTDRLKQLNLSNEQVVKMVPAGRLGEPEEIGNLATFLASERGAYITGQSIAVDGGILRGH